MKVERDSRTRAKVHKALVGIRDRFDIDIERGRRSQRALQHR
jgi:hypothetical protein